MPSPKRPLELAIGWRIGLYLAGLILLVVGLAGLVLPGIQGILTILLGLVLLSVTSQTAMRLMRWLFRRWPRGWRRFLRVRRRVERQLEPTPPSDSKPTGGKTPTDPDR